MIKDDDVEDARRKKQVFTINLGCEENENIGDVLLQVAGIVIIITIK